MPKISVITPSIRPDRLALVEKGLKNQEFTDFEWLVNDKRYEGGFWGLNRAYNDLFQQSKGELIVSLQDSIYINPEGLQKFWDAYLETKGCISGVGDQYDRLNEYGKPINKVWYDPRRTTKYGTFYECTWQDIEWNWAAIPRTAIFESGGFDEELDFLGFGGDQLQCMERITELGYKSYLDQTNESFTLRHGREIGGGQESWDKNHVVLNGRYDERKSELITQGLWPKLTYLM